MVKKHTEREKMEMQPLGREIFFPDNHAYPDRTFHYLIDLQSRRLDIFICKKRQ